MFKLFGHKKPAEVQLTPNQAPAYPPAEQPIYQPNNGFNATNTPMTAEPMSAAANTATTSGQTSYTEASQGMVMPETPANTSSMTNAVDQSPFTPDSPAKVSIPVLDGGVTETAPAPVGAETPPSAEVPVLSQMPQAPETPVASPFAGAEETIQPTASTTESAVLGAETAPMPSAETTNLGASAVNATAEAIPEPVDKPVSSELTASMPQTVVNESPDMGFNAQTPEPASQTGSTLPTPGQAISAPAPAESSQTGDSLTPPNPAAPPSAQL